MNRIRAYGNGHSVLMETETLKGTLEREKNRTKIHIPESTENKTLMETANERMNDYYPNKLDRFPSKV